MTTEPNSEMPDPTPGESTAPVSSVPGDSSNHPAGGIAHGLASGDSAGGGVTGDVASDGMVTDPVSRCTPEQVERLKQYVHLLLDVNIRINLISRKDTTDVFDRHVRHSLVLAARDFPDGCTVVDWGTGGGLPAIPLAIRFPNVNVVAVDSIGKKTRAVEEMASALGLKNLTVWNGRAEEWNGKAHYSVSRATARLEKLWSWHKRCRIPLDVSQHAAGSKVAGIDSVGIGFSRIQVGTSLWNPGLICLKGGDLAEEIGALSSREKKVRVSQRNIADIAPGYPDKCLVQVSRI